MAKLDFRKILRSDVSSDAPAWLERLLLPLNGALEALRTLMARGLTFQDNFRAQWHETATLTIAGDGTDFVDVTQGDGRYVKKSGDTMTGTLTVASPTGGDNNLNIGDDTTTGVNYIDFGGGGATYPDHGLRIIRYNGANAGSEINHRGTYDLTIRTYEAANVAFYTNNALRGYFGAADGLLHSKKVQVRCKGCPSFGVSPSTWTTVTWASGGKEVDTHSAMNTLTGVFTVPSNAGGIYLVGLKFTFTGVVSGKNLWARLLKNGAEVGTGKRVNYSAGDATVELSMQTEAAAGDQLSVQVMQDDTLSRGPDTNSWQCWLQIARIPTDL